MHTFEFKFFVDIPIDNHIDMEKRMYGGFVCNAESLKQCLICLRDEIRDIFPDKELIIGISSCSRNGKPIDYNYKNRVIYNCPDIRDDYWC